MFNTPSGSLKSCKASVNGRFFGNRLIRKVLTIKLGEGVFTAISAVFMMNQKELELFRVSSFVCIYFCMIFMKELCTESMRDLTGVRGFPMHFLHFLHVFLFQCCH